MGVRQPVSEMVPGAPEVNLLANSILNWAINGVNPTLAQTRQPPAPKKSSEVTRRRANKAKSTKHQAKAKALAAAKPTSRAALAKTEKEKLVVRSVQSLTIKDVPLPEATVEHLSALLADSTTLEELCLDGSLDPAHVSVLLDGVRANRSLRVLDLQGNGIAQDQIAPIAKAIVDCPSMEHINLCLNQIGKDGAAQLLDALDARREAYGQRDSSLGAKIADMQEAIESCKRHGVSPEKASPLQDGTTLDSLLEQLQIMGEAPLLKLDLRGNYDHEGAAQFETVAHSPPQKWERHPLDEVIKASSGRVEAMRFLLTADEHEALAQGAETHHHTEHEPTTSRFDDLFAEGD